MLPMADTLTDRALNRSTLARQLLLARAPLTPIAAVERLAGMQAQLARPPFVGLWTRLAGFERAQLIRAIERRQIVRGTLMRGTIHLVSTRDFVAMRPAIQPVLTHGRDAILKTWVKTIDGEALLTAARAHFARDPCTFADLRQHLLARFPALNERAMGYFVRMELPLVQVPDSGEGWAYPSAASFAVAESWLDVALDEGEGAEGLVRRYLAAFGPASVADFQIWSGLRGAKPVFERLRPKLRVFQDARGRELFDLPKAQRLEGDEDAPVRFLPDYDNLVMAYDDRSRIIAREHRPRVFTKNLQIPPTFLVDGFVAGTWRVERKARNARLLLRPFARLTKAVQRALETEAAPLLKFIEPDAASREVGLEAGTR
jgi:hypothetical protein